MERIAICKDGKFWSKGMGTSIRWSDERHAILFTDIEYAKRHIKMLLTTASKVESCADFFKGQESLIREALSGAKFVTYKMTKLHSESVEL